MFRHGVALVVFEAVARAIQRQCAHQAVARHLGDDRGGGDRHDNAVAADHRIAVARGVDLVAAVDEHMFRHLGQRTDRARQRPERGAQDIVAIDPRRRGKGDRKGRVAQISSNNSSRRSAVSRLELSIPLGIRFGSSTTAAATTGPASGPRPASSQPATGQTPRLISARSRRKLGGATAMTPFSSSACSLPASCRFSWRTCPESWPGSCESARTAQPETRHNSRYSARVRRFRPQYTLQRKPLQL